MRHSHRGTRCWPPGRRHDTQREPYVHLFAGPLDGPCDVPIFGGRQRTARIVIDGVEEIVGSRVS